MTTHDPALCDRDVCARCDAYGTGYAAGKDKAFFEVRAVLDACDHARGCGCEPCKLIRDVVDAVERMPAASARYEQAAN